jgi:hypothetical protein
MLHLIILERAETEAKIHRQIEDKDKFKTSKTKQSSRSVVFF